MFARLPEAAAQSDAQVVAIVVDGVAIDAREGDTVAVALLAAGIVAFRTTPAGGVPRGPFCLMGTCFDCAVEIDGRPNQQACVTRVATGMRIALARGAARLPGEARAGTL